MKARIAQFERQSRWIALGTLLTFVAGHILGGSLHEHCSETKTESIEIGHCQTHKHEEPTPTKPIPTDFDDDCDACILASIGHAATASEGTILSLCNQASILTSVIETETYPGDVLSASAPPRGPPVA